jgi:RNA polymerase sigma-70 factor (ECF subfamily)
MKEHGTVRGREVGEVRRFVPMRERDADMRILEACRLGDRAAFHDLFLRYKDRVYSIALHYTGDDAAAKDVSQTVFLKLFTLVSQFRYESEFSTWLFRVVANACFDDRRRRARLRPLEDFAEPRPSRYDGPQERLAERRDVEEAVRAAVAELPPKLRMAIVLRYLEGMSYDEIASVLGCSMGTVASRLNRGHKELAHRLGHLRGAIPSE